MGLPPPPEPGRNPASAEWCLGETFRPRKRGSAGPGGRACGAAGTDGWTDVEGAWQSRAVWGTRGEAWPALADRGRKALKVTRQKQGPLSAAGPAGAGMFRPKNTPASVERRCPAHPGEGSICGWSFSVVQTCGQRCEPDPDPALVSYLPWTAVSHPVSKVPLTHFCPAGLLVKAVTGFCIFRASRVGSFAPPLLVCCQKRSGR